MSAMLSKNHERFLSHLDESNRDAWLVAMWLQSKGKTVSVSAVHKAPSADQYEDFVDGGDLVLHRRAEVKGLSANFTGSHDWPFGNKFIVCSKDSFDRAKQKPELFFYLNNEKTHLAILDVRETKHSWFTEERHDARYGDNYKQLFYLCRPDQVKFIPMYRSA
jgi:hypothetical protein